MTTKHNLTFRSGKIRDRIVDYLAKHPGATSGVIAEALGLAANNTSSALNCMRHAGIVTRRRAGSLSPRDPQAEQILRFGRLDIDPAARQARIDGEDRPMTAYQFDLLQVLARHPGRVLTREFLLGAVKGESLEAFDRSIDVHISRIRAAIEDDPRHPRRILTLRGAGYVFTKSQDGI